MGHMSAFSPFLSSLPQLWGDLQHLVHRFAYTDVMRNRKCLPQMPQRRWRPRDLEDGIRQHHRRGAAIRQPQRLLRAHAHPAPSRPHTRSRDVTKPPPSGPTYRCCLCPSDRNRGLLKVQLASGASTLRDPLSSLQPEGLQLNRAKKKHWPGVRISTYLTCLTFASTRKAMAKFWELF